MAKLPKELEGQGYTSPALLNFDWDAPETAGDEDDGNDGFHDHSWTGLPPTGREFMEYMSLADATRADQVAGIDEFMLTGRAEHMPDQVSGYLRKLGLIE